MCANREQEFDIVLGFHTGAGNITWPQAANEMRDYIQDFRTAVRMTVNMKGFSRFTKGLFMSEDQVPSVHLQRMLKTTTM